MLLYQFLSCLRQFLSINPAYIRRRDLTEESFCITSLGGLYLEGLIHGGIFLESSVQYIAQVSNRDKTLSRFRILWNVLILSYLWL